MPPAPKAPEASPTKPLLDVAKAVIPGINTIMQGIATVEGAWKLLKGESPTMGKGASAPLAPATSQINEIALDRAFRHATASLFIKDVMRIGKMAGIDFTLWQGGRPPEPAAPKGAPASDGGTTTAPPVAPAPVSPAPVAPAPVAPTAGVPAAPAKEDFGRAQVLVDFVNSASLDDLKARAKLAVLGKIVRKDLDTIPNWYWNGSDQKGFGTPPEDGFSKIDFPKPYDPDADGRTWVQVSWYVSVAKLEETMLLGMPADVGHFSAISHEEIPAINVGWYEGGYVSSVKQEADGDKIDITLHPPTFKQGLNAPVGGYHMDFEFLWDRSATEMHADLTFHPVALFAPIFPNIKVSGEPKT